jgi:HSP20 family protein
MELIRWNPAREVFNFNRHFGSLFDDFFSPSEGVTANWHPVVDVYESDDAVVVKAELPGVDKKDVAVNLDGRILTLRGERSLEKEVKEEKFYRRERVYGKFERHFTLPEAVDPESIKADFKDGVLKIEIPRPVQSKPKQITVH